jgi:hypothetical protein
VTVEPSRVQSGDDGWCVTVAMSFASGADIAEAVAPSMQEDTDRAALHDIALRLSADYRVNRGNFESGLGFAMAPWPYRIDPYCLALGTRCVAAHLSSCSRQLRALYVAATIL